MSPTMTAPCRAGRTCRRGSSRAVGARRASSAGSEYPEAAKDGAEGGRQTRRDWCSRPQRAGDGGEQWTTCQNECESPTITPGTAGRGKEEEAQETGPQETWRKGQRPEVGQSQKGTPGPWGHEENQGPTEQYSVEKIQGIRIGLESEGATKDPVTPPLKNSHQNLLDCLAKKPVDRKCFSPQEQKPGPESGRKRDTGSSSRSQHP